MLGFGNVGRALAKLLTAKSAQVPFTVTAIVTLSHGWWVEPNGIPLDRVLASDRLPSSDIPPAVDELPADVIVELTTLDARTGRPAFDHIADALRARKHVVTANKGPIAHHYPELKELARVADRKLRFEASVSDCLPVFNLRRSALPLAEIRALRGIVSSTTNHILSAAARGMAFADALADAQRLGIAEADPTNDLEGWDAAVKATILASVLMDAHITVGDVMREPIDEAAAREAASAARSGSRLRPLIEIRHAGPDARDVTASFGPRRLEPLEPLYAVDGWSMALELDTDLAGRLVVQLHDPHVEQVAYAVLIDLLDIAGRPSRA